ncbi:MAG: hypothetical protein MRERV_17c017 [Mycoplasmataceae bacterium RV_VA103A]|nr:MAG: hypothetical protein MRERV_17c017 [Mycoplasmataceae bacterium RV_VA103A]
MAIIRPIEPLLLIANSGSAKGLILDFLIPFLSSGERSVFSFSTREEIADESLIKDLAYELGISLKKLDDILYCRINLLKLDDLAGYLEKLGVVFHLEIDKGFGEKRLDA